MFSILRNSFLLCAIALTASAASEENITRQLDVTPGGKLIVEVDFGNITVTAGAEDKVTLEAHRKIDFGDEAKEKEYLADAPIMFSKEGNVVTVRAHHPRRERFWNFGHSETDGHYTIRLPKRFEPDLHTAGGDISVAEINGVLKAHTSGGKLVLQHLEGTIAATTSGGSITVEDCRGPIEVETSGGDILATNGTGTFHAQTSGGRIDVRNFSGDAEIKTNGGNLVLERIAGKIAGKTSGGSIVAWVQGNVIGDVRLETSAGNIDVALPLDAPLDITAKTSVGQVINRLPLEVSEIGREHLRGKLNGGGKLVTLHTSAGNITLEPVSKIAGR
jgi:hypothetical protein